MFAATHEARRTKATKRLLKAQADNAPQPVVVSWRLRNVWPNGIWGADNRWTMAYHPATWYIDETSEKP